MQTTHGSGRTVVAKVVDDAIAGRRCSGCITSGRTENGKWGFEADRETSNNPWPRHAAYFRVRDNEESFRVRSKSEGCWWRVG